MYDHRRLDTASRASAALWKTDDEKTQMIYAAALSDWGDIGGYDLEPFYFVRRHAALLRPQLLQKRFLTKQKRSLAAFHREVAQACKTQKLPVPARNTVAQRIAGLHPAKIARSRGGQDAARPLQGAGGIPPEVTMPLEQVQIDHTVIDLIVFFFFTKPLVSWLAQFKFFSAGHKLSGFSAEQAGIDRIGAPRPAGGMAR